MGEERSVGWRQVAMLVVLLASVCARAQVSGSPLPADPYNYSRTSAFSYQANGLLASETIESTQPQLCVSTTYSYDAYGNRASAVTNTAKCTSAATGLAQFDERISSSTYAAQTGRIGTVNGSAAPIPAGTFAASALNALGHAESRVYDPRFGATVSLTGPNNLSTTWTVDDFGRKVLEQRADGTRTAMYYCWLPVGFSGPPINISSNSPGCHNGSAPVAEVPAPVANEVPDDAVRYEHSVDFDKLGNTPISGFTRVYFDRAGRKLRAVTQAFDGGSRLIVQDTDYNAYGVAIITTQPYFLSGRNSGSSTASGTGNDYGMTLTDMDALGRPINVYTSDPAAAGGSQANLIFGSRGPRHATLTAMAYKGLITTITADKHLTADKWRTRREEKNPDGKVVRITDASGSSETTGAQIVYQHDAFGNLVTTKDALGNQVQVAYDISGRKVSLNDPDAGVTSYCYDALGQLKAQQTSNQRGSHASPTCPTASGLGTNAPGVPGWTTFAYDLLGRMRQRAEPEYTTTWSYDSCTTGKGKLCQVVSSNGVTRTLAYDSLGRPQSNRTDVVNDLSVASTLSYNDATGRVATQTYPTGVRVSYGYTNRGMMNTVTLDTPINIAPLPATPGGVPASGKALAAGSVLWSASAVNAWGRAEQSSYGNTINHSAVFEPWSGKLTNLKAGPSATPASVVDQRYTWDSTNQLTKRIDALGDNGIAVSDTFGYDKLGRLTQYQVSGSGSTRTVTLQYNALGMLLVKSDVGNYSYPAQGVVNGRPHAVQSISGTAISYTYDLNGNAVSASTGQWRSIAYTSFNLPDATNGIKGPAGTPKLTWQYDENHQRIREDRTNASGTRTTWYLHPDNQGGLSFEHELAPNGVRSNRHFIAAGGGVFAVLVTNGALPNLAAGQTVVPPTTAVKLEYWHKDHLGSLIATTDHNGNVTKRYAYDPFGKRRYTNASYDPFGALVIDWTTDTNNGTDRGFTGHEHLDDVGLVNMNGRIFEPTIARFLQTDPFIQDPSNLQNYDRYGYCYNNPLTCTDPSGQSFGDAMLGGAIKSLRWIHPEVYWPSHYGARNPSTRVIGSIGIAAASAYWCGWFGPAAAAGCNAVGQAAWAGFAGENFNTVAKTGGLAFVSAYANSYIGDNYTTPLSNVGAHVAWGCAEGQLNGTGCRSGAIGGGLSAGMSQLHLDTGKVYADVWIHAAMGGIVAQASGGSFRQGAQSAAIAYLFNCAQHASCWKVPNDGEANFYRYGTPGNGEGSYAQARALSVIYDLDSRWGEIDSRRVGIGNVSLEDDSVFPPHSSHRDGLQMDIRPIRVDGREMPVNWTSSQYDRAATQKLVNILLSNPNVVKIYFNDPQIQGVSPMQGHNDHLHVEVRKGP